MNHTKGPWEVHKYNHCNGSLWLGIGYKDESGQSSGPICDIETEVHNHIRPKGFMQVAELQYLVTNEDEQWANANLIATAPELLEKCKQAFMAMGSMMDDYADEKYSQEKLDEIIDGLRNVINKAEMNQ